MLEQTTLPLKEIWQRWRLSPSWLRQLVLGVFLLVDSYLGLIYGAGIVAWTGLISGDLKWLTLSIEMMMGALMLVRILINQNGEL